MSAEVKATSKLMPLRLELAAGLARFGDALLGQVDVAPAGEQVLQVPLALAVAHEHEKAVGHFTALSRLRNPSAPAHPSSNKAPASASRAHSAACSAPRAKIMRSSALCTSSMPLGRAGEDHAVLADHGAAAQARQSRCRPALRAPVWPSRLAHRMLVELDAAAFRRRAAEQQRGAGRRIDLLVVMHLEDFDVEGIDRASSRRAWSAPPAD